MLHAIIYKSKSFKITKRTLFLRLNKKIRQLSNLTYTISNRNNDEKYLKYFKKIWYKKYFIPIFK